MSEAMRVFPCASMAGTLKVPGDKSISHRVAMLAGIASGRSVIEGFLRSKDCLNTLKAMQAMGAGVTVEDGRIVVEGAGGRLGKPAGALDLGNSGTSMRLLAGLVAGQPFSVEMTGDSSLRSRPMGRIREPLERMGARVELLGEGGRPPVRVSGGRLKGIEYALPVASAQVKSCVLLAGLFAEGDTVVIEPKATRDHTERILVDLGIPLAIDGLRIRLTGFGAGGPKIAGRQWKVPGDFSSAAFWIAAVACRQGSAVAIEGVGLNPRRTALIDVLRRMGADIETRPDADSPAGEMRGTVRVRGRRLKGTAVGGAEIPNLIDELPVLAVAAAMAEGETVVRDAAELRVKESDRIAAVAAELSAIGAGIEERKDGWLIRGGRRIRGGCTVKSYGDHRIAMASAILALFAEEPVRVEDVACVSTSYPGFWDDLKSVGGLCGK